MGEKRKKTGSECVVGVDIGAGNGSKIGVYDLDANLLAEGFLSVNSYGPDSDSFGDRLAEAMRAALAALPDREPIGIGLACPGIFSSDGTGLVVANIPILANTRPAAIVSSRFTLPTWLLNDAAAGGLAEWHLCKHEVVYWVLGGGWGGTWINSDGNQLIPSMGWSGKVEDLNCVNEPGFIIPLYRSEITPIAEKFGLSWENLLTCLPEGAVISGGVEEWVRAETVTASCGGIRRLFKAFLKYNPRGKEIADPSGDDNCEMVLGNLAEQGFEPAENTEAFFAESWALAVDRFYDLSAKHGLTPSVPVHLAGGVSNISNRFLPALQNHLRRRGVEPSFRISQTRLANINANLLGAGMLAIRGVRETVMEK